MPFDSGWDGGRSTPRSPQSAHMALVLATALEARTPGAPVSQAFSVAVLAAFQLVLLPGQTR